MDSNTHTPRTATFARRALPVFAIAVLTIGLGACQTPRQGETAPTGHKVETVHAPAGVDINRPADRVEEQLQRNAAEAKANAGRFRGLPADRVEQLLAREAADGQERVSAITLEGESIANQLAEAQAVDTAVVMEQESIAKQLADAQAKAAPPVGSWTDRITAEIEYRAAQPHLDME